MPRIALDHPVPERVLKIFLAILLLALVGCATPVGVRHLSHEKAYRTLTASVLSGEGLSEPTVQLVNRVGLAEAYQDAPADTIADLHQRISAQHDSNLLFALAELSFQHAIDTANLLLFAQLATILGQTGIFLLAVLAGRISPALDTAFVGKTFFAFQEQLLAFTAALTAFCIKISSQDRLPIVRYDAF